MSVVSEIPAAQPAAVLERYSERLSFETDCSDVYQAMRAGQTDFVLFDVRGPKLYADKHVPGAINLPHGKMTASKLEAWRQDTLFVVYCAGPHCNGTDRAALRIARLGYHVKVMIGGITGWADEGLPFACGDEPGSIDAGASAAHA
jgi:rhodanese-related sulfurtransferase